MATPGGTGGIGGVGGGRPPGNTTQRPSRRNALGSLLRLGAAFVVGSGLGTVLGLELEKSRVDQATQRLSAFQGTANASATADTASTTSDITTVLQTGSSGSSSTLHVQLGATLAAAGADATLTHDLTVAIASPLATALQKISSDFTTAFSAAAQALDAAYAAPSLNLSPNDLDALQKVRDAFQTISSAIQSTQAQELTALITTDLDPAAAMTYLHNLNQHLSDL